MKRCFGWKPDIPDFRDHLFAMPSSEAAAVFPPHVDLTPQSPQPYNQGQLGSCTANAIACAVEFDRMKQKLSVFTPSRLFLYYNERNMEGTVSVDSGAYIRDGIKSIAQMGDCPETEWPYTISKFAKKPPVKCYRDALKYTAVNYQRIVNKNNIDGMRACLAAGYPFVFGITVYESFPMNGSGIVPMPIKSEKVLGGHAIVALGYDDASQRIIFRNSWGAAWGDKGNGTIPYEYLTNDSLADDFWTIRLVK